jgi:hypothetical protein
MSGEPAASDRHPAPQADRLSSAMAFFMLFAGPIAWFLQLCLGTAMTGWPCFPMTDRLGEPMAGYGWTRIGALVLLLVCALIALAAGLVSLAKLREVRGEKGGGHAELLEIGHGRTRFVAIWGVILGLGFALATLATLVAFAMVPRCAG